MKIISKFRDYYDYVSKIYDSDYNVVYNRKSTIENIKLDYYVSEDFYNNFKIDKFINRWRWNGSKIGWLCVCGKVYMVDIKDTITGRNITIVNKKDHKELFNENKKCWWITNIIKEPEEVYGLQHNEIIRLSILLNQPIFIIKDFKNNRVITIDKEIPTLLETGFNHIMKAEILHQELDYYIGNIMKTPPDTAPPVEISNKDKITQYGFDLKQSFRHRK